MLGARGGRAGEQRGPRAGAGETRMPVTTGRHKPSTEKKKAGFLPAARLPVLPPGGALSAPPLLSPPPLLTKGRPSGESDLTTRLSPTVGGGGGEAFFLAA